MPGLSCRRLLTAVLPALLIATLASAPAVSQTATDSRTRGFERLKQGDAQGAIDLLRATVKDNKADDEAWHALGLAYAIIHDTKKSADSFKTAATLRLNKVLAGGPRAVPSDQPQIRTELARTFSSAVDSIERYIAASSSPERNLTADLNALRFYRDFYLGQANERIVASKEVTTRLRIQDKPPPDFSGTRAAGLATLRAVFSAEGTIKHIVVIRKVDPEFDQACREAAKKIRFTPAIKDGQPVSMILQLEYSRSFF